MKTLIIHHLEPTWEEGYKNHGTSCWEICVELNNYLEKEFFENVILTQFEDWKPNNIHIETGINNHIDQYEEYGYGWEAECFLSSDEYCEGGNHSSVVYIPEWIKNLKQDSVYLCGAFDGECVEDMEIALNHCVGRYKRIEEFII